MSERLAHRYKQHWEVLFVPTHLRATASYYPRVEPYTSCYYTVFQNSRDHVFDDNLK